MAADLSREEINKVLDQVKHPAIDLTLTELGGSFLRSLSQYNYRGALFRFNYRGDPSDGN